MENEEILNSLRINFLKRKNHITVASKISREKEIADFICDGVNDEEEIKQAINDLPVGGGIVELLDGEFVTSSPIIIEKDNVVFKGQGAGDRKKASIDDSLAIGTRILANYDFIGDALIIVARNDAMRPVAHTQLQDFTVDGNGVPGPINGIDLLSFRNKVSKVHIFECSGHGLRIRGMQTWNPYDCYYSRLLLGYNLLNGMHYEQYSPDSHASQIISFLNGQDGVYLQGASHQFVSLHTYGNKRHGLQIVSGSARNKVVNWKSEQNTHGLCLDGSNGGVTDTQIVATNFKNNGYNTTGDHIFAVGGVFRTNLTNINISSTSPTTAARYGINLSGATIEDTNITSLHINSGGNTYSTAAINDLGKRTVIESVGTNAGNPNTTGHWKGKGKEGISVFDTLNNKIYMFVRGLWYPLN